MPLAAGERRLQPEFDSLFRFIKGAETRANDENVRVIVVARCFNEVGHFRTGTEKCGARALDTIHGNYFPLPAPRDHDAPHLCSPFSPFSHFSNPLFPLFPPFFNPPFSLFSL